MSDYKSIIDTLPSLIEGIDYDITILSNTSALLKEYIEDINWVGFYINKDNMLKLGPFQGKVACMEIPFSRGVCGKCAREEKSILIENVHEFEGHIACDSRSNSEICIPIILKDKFYGLLDIDSPTVGRFSFEDQKNLETIVHILENALKN